MTTHRPISFEFFPPKTPEGREKLLLARDRLAVAKPDFFSVTYGAGGSTRDNTRDIVLQIHKDGYTVAPHLSFGGDTEAELMELVQTYKDAGIRHIVALRGDAPSGVGSSQMVNANELVELLRKHFGDHFDLKVAAYPEIHPDAEGYERDIYWLGRKFDAGANRALTQFFFNPDAYFFYMEQCEKQGIEHPVVPGIMPIFNYEKLVRFSDGCGADVPRWLRQRMESFGDDKESIKTFGEDVISRLCERLLEGGAPGFHFYTMNQSELSLNILRNIGLLERGAEECA